MLITLRARLSLTELNPTFQSRVIAAELTQRIQRLSALTYDSQRVMTGVVFENRPCRRHEFLKAV